MKILIVLPDRDVGGGQIAAIRLAAGLSQSHQVSVIVACPEIGDVEPPQIPDGIEVLPSIPGEVGNTYPPFIWFFITVLDFLLPPWRWTRGSGFLVQNLNRKYQEKRRQHFIGTVEDGDFDVINSHAWRSDYFVGECMPDSWSTPWVITLHGCYESLLSTLGKHPEYESQIRKVLNKVDQILYTAQKNLNVLSTIDQIQLTVEPIQAFNGIEVNPPSMEAAGGTRSDGVQAVLVLVARAIPEKGWEQAIQAVTEINQEGGYSIKLILAGEGPYLRELRKKTQDPMVDFVGHSANPLALLAQCDIGLLPSYFASESYPLSVIEYLCCGKPVIATDVGEIRAMLESEGQTAGQLLQLGPNGKANVAELKAAIRCYVDQPQLLEAHRKLAVDAAEKFSLEKIVQSYESVFNTLDKQRP